MVELGVSLEMKTSFHLFQRSYFISKILTNSNFLNVDREYVKGSWLQGILFPLVSSTFPIMNSKPGIYGLGVRVRTRS